VTEHQSTLERSVEHAYADCVQYLTLIEKMSTCILTFQLLPAPVGRIRVCCRRQNRFLDTLQKNQAAEDIEDIRAQFEIDHVPLLHIASDEQQLHQKIEQQILRLHGAQKLLDKDNYDNKHTVCLRVLCLNR